MSCNPKDLTINHISSGANYLKKINQQQQQQQQQQQ